MIVSFGEIIAARPILSGGSSARAATAPAATASNSDTFTILFSIVPPPRACDVGRRHERREEHPRALRDLHARRGEARDLLRRVLAALGELAHLGRDHREAAP